MSVCHVYIFTQYVLIRVYSCLFNFVMRGACLCNFVMCGALIRKLARILFIFAREIHCNGSVIQNEFSII